MKETDEQLGNQVALKVFEHEIKRQLHAPLDVDEVYTESPKLITPYRASSKDTSFWRIPILSRKYSRVIGYFDVRSLDEQSSAFRVSRLPRRAIENEEDIRDLPTDVLELSDSDIRNQLIRTFGDNIRLVSKPQLVFDQAETRVAWQLDVEKEGKVFSAMVTPGYAYVAGSD